MIISDATRALIKNTAPQISAAIINELEKDFAIAIEKIDSNHQLNLHRTLRDYESQLSNTQTQISRQIKKMCNAHSQHVTDLIESNSKVINAVELNSTVANERKIRNVLNKLLEQRGL